MAEQEKTAPCDTLAEARVRGDMVSLDLWYPRSSEVKQIEIGLMDVRAADAIRVSYDFDRDGYVIKQERVIRYEGAFGSHDPEQWVEVAFIQAWGLEGPDDEEE